MEFTIWICTAIIVFVFVSLAYGIGKDLRDIKGSLGRIQELIEKTRDLDR